MPDIRVGISGWTYAPWRGTFFPRGLPRTRELAYAAERLRTIEINGTFYSQQRPSSFATWYEQTPEDFRFALKGPRFITHLKRLNDVVGATANFFASGVLRLGAKLGPILWQLPPATRFDPERLAAFFQLLPRSTREAAVLARQHDHRLRSRAWLRVDADRPIRHALEVRHGSFLTGDFVRLLRRHEIALVVADSAGRWPMLQDVTSDPVYVRLHGDEELYASGYSAKALHRWADRIRAWAAGGDAPDTVNLDGPAPRVRRGRDVYVYFDNDVKTHAPFDAMNLAHELGLGPPAPDRGTATPARVEAVRSRWAGWAPGARRRVRPGNMQPAGAVAATGPTSTSDAARAPDARRSGSGISTSSGPLGA